MYFFFKETIYNDAELPKNRTQLPVKPIQLVTNRRLIESTIVKVYDFHRDVKYKDHFGFDIYTETVLAFYRLTGTL